MGGWGHGSRNNNLHTIQIRDVKFPTRRIIESKNCSRNMPGTENNGWKEYYVNSFRDGVRICK